MTQLLWTLAIIGCYLAFILWRAKFALNTLQDENHNFQNPERRDRTRNEAKPRVRRFIERHAPELEQRGYRLLSEHTNLSFMGGDNYHCVYTSADGRTTCEISYTRLPLAVRFLAVVIGDLKGWFKADLFVLTAETNFTNGEALFTAAMDKAELPRWIHVTWMEPGTPFDVILPAHEAKLAELSAAPAYEVRTIRSTAEFFQKEKDQRERLGKQQQLDFEALVAENRVEWLIEERNKDPR